MVQPYSDADMAISWKNYCLILSNISDFHIVINVNNTSYFTNAYVDIAFSRWDITTEVYEFQKLAIQWEDGTISIKTHGLSFILVHAETNTSCCLFQAMQQIFGLSGCIWKER